MKEAIICVADRYSLINEIGKYRLLSQELQGRLKDSLDFVFRTIKEGLQVGRKRDQNKQTNRNKRAGWKMVGGKNEKLSNNIGQDGKK